MKNVKTHTFGGKKYEIFFKGDADGYTTNPGKSYALILNTDLDDMNGIVTIIHEGLHACQWSMHEDTVDQISKDIGRFLWRLGYRKIKK